MFLLDTVREFAMFLLVTLLIKRKDLRTDLPTITFVIQTFNILWLFILSYYCATLTSPCFCNRDAAKLI